MRNIVVVELGSTGVNYIQDIINRNYNPIALQLAVDGNTEGNKNYKKLVKESINSIDADFEIIYEKESYEETLEMVRKYDPLLVIPATEKGVILATKLANDLNLLSNPLENLDAMTFKDKMQERIAEYGLRHIRGHVVSSVEEAVEFYDKNNLKEVVVKPIYSSGSVGVRICLNRNELIDSLNMLFEDVNFYGDINSKMLIQEYINGEEYIVNTVSHDGVHRVTTIWKYQKITTSEGGHIYESMNSINELSIGDAELVEYAYKVADAMGIKYGPVHGEYMVDDDGPVLIEVNCRPMGGGMPVEFLDRVSGQHETDSSLDSYLYPRNFEYERLKGYKLYEHGALKFFIIPNDILAESVPVVNVTGRLKSYLKASLHEFTGQKLFYKTQDLETSAGTVFLIHQDKYIVQRDIEFLRNVEKFAFQLVLSDRSGKLNVLDEDETFESVRAVLNRISDYGSTLFVTDQIFDDIDLLQVSPQDIDDAKGEFSYVVVNLNESILNKKDDFVSLLLLQIIAKVRHGGLIFIPKSTYQYVTNGRKGVEALIKVLDLKIHLPLYDLNEIVIAQK